MEFTPKKCVPTRTQKPDLTIREIQFCQFYAVTGNATQAFLDAGFLTISNNSAQVRAFGLLRKVKIREYVQELRGAAADTAKLTVEIIAQGLLRDGWADRRTLFDADGRLLPPHQWPDDVAATIQSIEVEELPRRKGEDGPPRFKYKVKTTDRLKARQIAAQWRQMLNQEKSDRNEKHEPLVIGGEADVDAL